MKKIDSTNPKLLTKHPDLAHAFLLAPPLWPAPSTSTQSPPRVFEHSCPSPLRDICGNIALSAIDSGKLQQKRCLLRAFTIGRSSKLSSGCQYGLVQCRCVLHNVREKLDFVGVGPDRRSIDATKWRASSRNHIWLPRDHSRRL